MQLQLLQLPFSSALLEGRAWTWQKEPKMASAGPMGRVESARMKFLLACRWLLLRPDTG